MVSWAEHYRGLPRKIAAPHPSASIGENTSQTTPELVAARVLEGAFTVAAMSGAGAGIRPGRAANLGSMPLEKALGGKKRSSTTVPATTEGEASATGSADPGLDPSRILCLRDYLPEGMVVLSSSSTVVNEVDDVLFKSVEWEDSSVNMRWVRDPLLLEQDGFTPVGTKMTTVSIGFMDAYLREQMIVTVAAMEFPEDHPCDIHRSLKVSDFTVTSSAVTIKSQHVGPRIERILIPGMMTQNMEQDVRLSDGDVALNYFYQAWWDDRHSIRMFVDSAEEHKEDYSYYFVNFRTAAEIFEAAVMLVEGNEVSRPSGARLPCLRHPDWPEERPRLDRKCLAESLEEIVAEARCEPEGAVAEFLRSHTFLTPEECAAVGEDIPAQWRDLVDATAECLPEVLEGLWRSGLGEGAYAPEFLAANIRYAGLCRRGRRDSGSLGIGYIVGPDPLSWNYRANSYACIFGARPTDIVNPSQEPDYGEVTLFCTRVHGTFGSGDKEYEIHYPLPGYENTWEYQHPEFVKDRAEDEGCRPDELEQLCIRWEGGESLDLHDCDLVTRNLRPFLGTECWDQSARFVEGLTNEDKKLGRRVRTWRFWRDDDELREVGHNEWPVNEMDYALCESLGANVP